MITHIKYIIYIIQIVLICYIQAVYCCYLHIECLKRLRAISTLDLVKNNAQLSFSFSQAGIVSSDKPDQLLIALEPEAASIYCRRLRLFQVLTADDSTDDNRSIADNNAKTANEKRTSSWSLPELRGTDISLIPNDLQTGQ